MVLRRAEVPTVDTPRCPRASRVSVFIDDCFAPQGGKGIPVPVIRSIHGFICRHSGVDPGFAHQVETRLDLRCEFVPQLDGKVHVCCGQGRNECILKCLDGPFGHVHTMIVWFEELQVAIILRKESLDVFCGLIIHDVELRLESFAGEFVEVFLVCVKDCFVVQTFDGGGKDEVGFVMVQNKETDAAIQ